MDGLYILFGILTLTFLVVVLGMNLANSQITKIEKFVDAKDLITKANEMLGNNSQETGGPKSEIQTMIRGTMDKLALNTSPDGTPISDGADLCSIYADIRKSMALAEKGIQPAIGSTPGSTDTISDAEIVKRVEVSLSQQIPGGPLPCPLLQYPPSNASDASWVSWLQNLPRDFGARVVFMAVFADEKITSNMAKIQEFLNTEVDPPKTNFPALSENFGGMCTPTLNEVRQKNSDAISCDDPTTMDAATLSKVVSAILQDMIEVRDKKVINTYMPRTSDPNASQTITTDVHKHIANSKMNIAKVKNIMNDPSYGGFKTKFFDKL